MLAVHSSLPVKNREAETITINGEIPVMATPSDNFARRIALGMALIVALNSPGALYNAAHTPDGFCFKVDVYMK